MAKRLGRPPLDPSAPLATVSLRLPAKQFDALCQQARQAAISVPEVIRRKIRRADFTQHKVDPG
jgi:hypothetical protein